MRAVEGYRRGRNVDVTVVFDSRRGRGQRFPSPYAGIEVEFAAGDADRRIVELVRRSSSRRDLVVVTSDRALADQVRDLGARTESSADFTRKCEPQERRRGGPSAKTNPRLSRAEIESWEREFLEQRSEPGDGPYPP